MSSTATSASQISREKQNSHPHPDIRTAVVEVLSATANGCLSELGYFPGMPAHLQNTEQLNKRLMEENRKLYEDNVSLLRRFTSARDRLSLIEAPEEVKVQKMMAMNDHIRVLVEEKDELIKKNEVMVSGLSKDGGHQFLAYQFNKLEADHRALLQEVKFLREECRRLKGIVQGPVVSSQPSPVHGPPQHQNPSNIPQTQSHTRPASHIAPTAFYTPQSQSHAVQTMPPNKYHIVQNQSYPASNKSHVIPGQSHLAPSRTSQGPSPSPTQVSYIPNNTQSTDFQLQRVPSMNQTIPTTYTQPVAVQVGSSQPKETLTESVQSVPVISEPGPRAGPIAPPVPGRPKVILPPRRRNLPRGSFLHASPITQLPIPSGGLPTVVQAYPCDLNSRTSRQGIVTNQVPALRAISSSSHSSAISTYLQSSVPQVLHPSFNHRGAALYEALARSTSRFPVILSQGQPHTTSADGPASQTSAPASDSVSPSSSSQVQDPLIIFDSTGTRKPLTPSTHTSPSPSVADQLQPVALSSHSSSSPSTTAPLSITDSSDSHKPVAVPSYILPSRFTPPQGPLPSDGSVLDTSATMSARLSPVSIMYPLPLATSESPSTPATCFGDDGQSPIEVTEAKTPISGPTEREVTVVTSAFEAEPRLVKRSNMEMVDEDSEARKKPRWGEEMKTEYSGGLGSVTQINEASEDEDSDDDDDDDDGEVIEVDGDGLRLREQCVALMMDDDDNEEAKQICKACNSRFEMGLIKTPPQPFIRASLDELVQHCSVEHPAAWELLRNPQRRAVEDLSSS